MMGLLSGCPWHNPSEKPFSPVLSPVIVHVHSTHQPSIMAPVLGKRKRREHSADVDANNVSSADDHYANLQALFQQHFESTFEPLPGSLTGPSLVHKTETEPSDGELGSDWNGFSDHGEEYAETVHCDSSAPSKADISKEEFKTFMVRAQIAIVH